MSSITALLTATLAIFLTFAHATEIGACDGILAGAMSSRKLRSQDLYGFCSTHYSQGVCLAAGEMITKQLKAGEVSVEEFASSACNAVKAASAQHEALQRRALPPTSLAESSAEASPRATLEQDLAAVRSSPEAHRLSSDVAQQYRDRASSAAGSFVYRGRQGAEVAATDVENLDDVLHHKQLPFPHGTFGWEKNHTTVESKSLEDAVKKWKQEHREGIDISRPEVVQRAAFYKDFKATDNLNNVVSPDSSAKKVDVSFKDKAAKKEQGAATPATPASKPPAAKPAAASAAQVVATPAKLPKQDKLAMEMLQNKPYTKTFLASGKELKSLLSHVMG